MGRFLWRRCYFRRRFRRFHHFRFLRDLRVLCQPVVVAAVAAWWASSSSSLTEPWFLSGTELNENPLVVVLG